MFIITHKMKNEITPFTGQLLSTSLKLIKIKHYDINRGSSTKMCALKLLGSLLANKSDVLFKTNTKEEEEESEHRLMAIRETLEGLYRTDPSKEVRDFALSLNKLIF